MTGAVVGEVMGKSTLPKHAGHLGYNYKLSDSGDRSTSEGYPEFVFSALLCETSGGVIARRLRIQEMITHVPVIIAIPTTMQRTR
jgi:hypothetical protein